MQNTPVCPITQFIFRHPVLASDDQVYELKELVCWFAANNKRISPLTREEITWVVPNRPLERDINGMDQSSIERYQDYDASIYRDQLNTMMSVNPVARRRRINEVVNQQDPGSEQRSSITNMANLGKTMVTTLSVVALIGCGLQGTGIDENDHESKLNRAIGLLSLSVIIGSGWYDYQLRKHSDQGGGLVARGMKHAGRYAASIFATVDVRMLRFRHLRRQHADIINTGAEEATARALHQV